MSIKTIGVAWLLAASLLPAAAHAQAGGVTAPTRAISTPDLKNLQAYMRQSRRDVVAQNLRLTPDEAKRFWPVYDRYAADQTKIKDVQYAMIADYAKTYGKYDDKAASVFIARWLDLDMKSISLRTRYLPQVGKALPGIKAATFFQIDRRINMAIDLKITQLVPFLQDQKTLAR
jgi:hypothetical protein